MGTTSGNVACAVLVAHLSLASRARADDPAPKPPTQEQPADTDLRENKSERKIIKKWNQYDFKWFTLKWGIYTIDEFATAIQSEASASEVDVERSFKVRDFRVTFNGKFSVLAPPVHAKSSGGTEDEYARLDLDHL